jgi:predicted SnoaL-like aldol condensation-catalyzing enzyme
MTATSPEQNKTLVLKAFDTLFNKRDYLAAEPYWSPTYVQHSAHIRPGRDGLFDLVRSLPGTLRYENHVIVAKATTSSRTVAFRATDVVDHGLPPTSCVSKTASSPSIVSSRQG